MKEKFILRERVFYNGVLVGDDYISNWVESKAEIIVPQDFTMELSIGKVEHKYCIDAMSEFMWD